MSNAPTDSGAYECVCVCGAHFFDDNKRAVVCPKCKAPAPTDSAAERLSTDDAAPEIVLAAVQYCARHWVPDARIVGNVRAGDIVRAIDAVLTPPAVAEGGDQGSVGMASASPTPPSPSDGQGVVATATVAPCPFCKSAPRVSDYRETSDETGEVEGYAGVECHCSERGQPACFIGVHADTLDDAKRIWNAALAGSRHPVASDGEGSAAAGGAMPTEPTPLPLAGREEIAGAIYHAVEPATLEDALKAADAVLALLTPGQSA